MGEMMVLKIIDKKKNALLKREEVHASYDHSGKPTPTRDEILPHLERSLKAKKDLIFIDKIFSIKGKGESNLKVFVYSKKEDIPKNKLEILQKRAEKEKPKEPAPAEQKPAEPPKEGEAPAEAGEKKEEVKEEKTEEPEKKEEAEEKPKEEEAKSGKKPEEKEGKE